MAVETLSEEAWQAGRESKKFLDQEVIVIIGILSDPINHGYEISRLPVLHAFNGVKVRAHLALRILLLCLLFLFLTPVFRSAPTRNHYISGKEHQTIERCR